MMRYGNTNKLIFFTLLAVLAVVAFCLPGCGGGGDGDDGGDSDDGASYPAYSEQTLSFGGVVIDHYVDQTITLKNVSDIKLTFEDIEYPDDGPFTVVRDTCSEATLSDSGTCDIQVRFTPTEQTSYFDEFVVPLSGSDTDFVGVYLEGDGYGYNVSINHVDTDECPAIRLLVSVTDSLDDPVSGLTENDFSLYEGDDEIQWGSGNTISAASEVEFNLSVILLVDTSGSIEDVLPEVQAAATAFIDAMDPANEVAIFEITAAGGKLLTTSTSSGFLTADESGKAALEGVINDLSAGGDTALYQSVIDAAGHMEDYASDENRHAIVLLTDGEDTSSSGGIDEAIAAAEQAGVPLMTIGLGVSDEDTGVITQLAEDTHGQSFLDLEADELETIYTQILAILSSQYEIVYSSTSGDEMVSIRVAVDDGDNYGEDTREIEGCSE